MAPEVRFLILDKIVKFIMGYREVLELLGSIYLYLPLLTDTIKVYL